MLKMRIIARSGEYDAELDDSELSQAVWFSAHHFTAAANDLTGTLFFEMPVDVESDAERQTVFDVGDIAWWPGVNARVIFYGPTPLSGEDGNPSGSTSASKSEGSWATAAPSRKRGTGRTSFWIRSSDHFESSSNSLGVRGFTDFRSASQ
jgi:hypothetical protein